MIDFGSIGGLRSNDPTQQSNAEVDKQAFLQLLVTQLKSQDPFEPLKNEDFLAQLAQFSSLESLNNIYEELGTNNLLQSSVHSALSTSLIGNYGVTIGDTMTVSGDEVSGVLYAMPDSGDVRITITDETGNVVKVVEESNVRAGDRMVEWDGKNESGDRVSDGNYSVAVEITSGAKAGSTAQVFNVGRIHSVRFFDGNPVIVIDNREYLLSDILEVSETLPGEEA